MRVHYTARRKRGLVAASKRMQVEGMTLCATASELVLPPPANPKSPSKNEGATPSPGHFGPIPVVLRLIVMLSTIATGRIVQFRPPGRKMKAIPSHPPSEYCRFSLLYAEQLRLPPAVRAHTLAHTGLMSCF